MDGRRGLMMARRSSAQVANVGDIAYKASNGKIMVVAQDAWDSSLGAPVGVVVIPSGFAPDNGLARIVSLYWVNTNGASSTTASGITWSNVNVDTSLANHNRVPTTDNAGSTTTGSGGYGYLPSDNFTGATSYVDPTAKYYGSKPYIPSPYLGDKPNPAYYAPISGYSNALADFNGKGNTDVFVSLGSDYLAANAARSYKAVGAEDVEWYLPAMGELGFLLPRFNKIQAALTKASAALLLPSDLYWSSTENSLYYIYYTYAHSGEVDAESKRLTLLVRPFAQLDF